MCKQLIISDFFLYLLVDVKRYIQLSIVLLILYIRMEQNLRFKKKNLFHQTYVYLLPNSLTQTLCKCSYPT